MNEYPIVVKKDAVSLVLWKRWIACYMLYGWNFYHADCVFQSNEVERYQKAYHLFHESNIFNEQGVGLSEMEKYLTEVYNRVLLEDVENFICDHLEAGYSDRQEVEFQMARAEAAAFEEGGGDEAGCA